MFAAGWRRASGCGCRVNIILLCKDCHRYVVHGVNGGWSTLIAVAKFVAHISQRYDAALTHWEARQRGEPLRCNRNSKLAEMARRRIAAAAGG